mgnify:CR=1 FL=1
MDQQQMAEFQHNLQAMHQQMQQQRGSAQQQQTTVAAKESGGKAHGASLTCSGALRALREMLSKPFEGQPLICYADH